MESMGKKLGDRYAGMGQACGAGRRAALRPRPRGCGVDCAHHGRAQAVEGRYGAARIHAELRRQGRLHSVSGSPGRCARPGLAGRVPRRWKKTTIPVPAAAARADSIRRDFTADASKINQLWCGDIT